MKCSLIPDLLKSFAANSRILWQTPTIPRCLILPHISHKFYPETFTFVCPEKYQGIMSNERKRREALVYHAKPQPGKIQVVPTKKYSTQRDLSLAYSPGVAEPCLEIAKDKENAYKYTTKGNLVAVISNGTAVLGLGDIGPDASKPVMEGKGLLFKIFS